MFCLFIYLSVGDTVGFREMTVFFFLFFLFLFVCCYHYYYLVMVMVHP